MAYADTLPKQRPFGVTSRPDNWWLQPLAVFLGFSAFIVYSTWAAFHPLYHGNCAYWFGGNGANYLSPFFSPEIFGYSPHALLGGKPSWWPSFLIFSPAFLVLWAPGGFRFTCYYYRGAYYKAFWADPLNCAVGEPRKIYWGERYLPLILQNIHRYFFYLAALFIVLLAHDAWKAMWFTDMTGVKHFGVGVGTIVLTLNAIFLALYTFGCHSLRHLIGGFLDSKSKAPSCAKAYNCVSCLNKKHMNWAWVSLFWVGFTDVYVRLCAMGIWHDWRIF
ncbi:MAG TPA: succinate dehydrogenase [Verrucomicrobiae bacterium]|nr:succinate dehydrogenase [Verrucomicrobiae bacterium]